uniref:Transmembrane protein 199 n=1 Tax=Oncorhynchus mykiss TaxID=8022 RepID=A0A8K9Y485_ONCMY
MASSFVIGNTFRERVRDLLEKDEASVPTELQKELEDILQREQPSTLSFRTARKLHKCLLDNGQPFYLNELLEDSSLHLPEVETPPRNPVLVARLERIRAKLANEEYNRITRNVNTQQMNRRETLADFGKEGYYGFQTFACNQSLKIVTIVSIYLFLNPPSSNVDVCVCVWSVSSALSQSCCCDGLKLPSDSGGDLRLLLSRQSIPLHRDNAEGDICSDCCVRRRPGRAVCSGTDHGGRARRTIAPVSVLINKTHCWRTMPLPDRPVDLKNGNQRG